MDEKAINVADAKKHFSELLGQVAYTGKSFLITKRGKPMARLMPIQETHRHLADAKGWLDDDDPFFRAIENIVQTRGKHPPRVFAEPTGD